MMKTRLLAISIIVALIAILISSCMSAASSPTPASTTTLDGATLVQERCSRCHPLSRVESARYSAAEWQSIVSLMISRGAQLTPEEETVVVTYLAANFGK
jgi:hypothetical protein